VCWSAGHETCVDMSVQKGTKGAGQGLDGVSVIATWYLRLGTILYDMYC